VLLRGELYGDLLALGADGRRLKDYVRWHAAQVTSGDIDPVYPVFDELARAWRLRNEERAWLVFLHVAWYHPGSTLVAFARVPSLAAMPRTAEGLAELGLLDLPCNTERRGHRTRSMLAAHLLQVAEVYRDAGGAHSWAMAALDGAAGTAGWTRLFDALTTLRGNGRWAAYKTVEMLQKVVGLPLVAADAGHAYSSGPRKGLVDLGLGVDGNDSAAVAELNRRTDLLAAYLGEDDLAQVETSLCDFHSLVSGHYYLGNDIDSMLGDWLSTRLPPRAIPAEAWDAREARFASGLLGEHGGWQGVRPQLRRMYRDRGIMVGVADKPVYLPRMSTSEAR